MHDAYNTVEVYSYVHDVMSNSSKLVGDEQNIEHIIDREKRIAGKEK